MRIHACIVIIRGPDARGVLRPADPAGGRNHSHNRNHNN